MAVVLVMTFGLTVFATDADHCLDACETCPNDAVATGELMSRGVPADGDDGSEARCLGAGCLCHHPRISAAIELSESLAPSELTFPPRPMRPELDVTDEISHIPKHLG